MTNTVEDTAQNTSGEDIDQKMDAVFERARKAQKRWARVPVKQRKEIFLRYHDLVLNRQDELIDTNQRESTKGRWDAFYEIMDVAITARHLAYAAPKLLATKKVPGALPVVTNTEVQREPVGVVGVISPWNYPLTLAVSDAIGAILAGNAVVLKPDSNTPAVAQLAVQMMVDAGLDPDLFQVVPGSGRTVGQGIVARCDYLMFTGSTETGRALAQQAGERLIGFSAELGGKNPLIVTADADVERAAHGAIEACFSNAGQLCISIERIYVHEAVADQFIDRFAALARDMRIGPDWTDDIGSLITTDQQDSVAEFVDDAVGKGATVLAGGRRIGEQAYAPTVLVDVPEDARLHREEVFGPVVYIERVRHHDEAIERANDTEYGLNASIWGKVKTARRIASQIEAGTVNINEGYAAAWASMSAPMGGWKASGMGRRHSDEAILKFTEARTVAVQHLMLISGPKQVSRETWSKVLTTALKAGKHILR